MGMVRRKVEERERSKGEKIVSKEKRSREDAKRGEKGERVHSYHAWPS